MKGLLTVSDTVILYYFVLVKSNISVVLFFVVNGNFLQTHWGMITTVSVNPQVMYESFKHQKSTSDNYRRSEEL